MRGAVFVFVFVLALRQRLGEATGVTGWQSFVDTVRSHSRIGRMRHWLASLVLVGCGSVSSNPMDAPKSDTPADMAVDSAPICGAAGQGCCASNVCSAGLTCTTGDQVCRSTTTFVLGQDTSNNGFVAVGSGTTFTPTTLGAGQPTAIWGTSPSDVWVILVTNPGATAQVSYARHYNGSSWEPAVGLPSSGLVYGMWGAAANNYWAVNNAGNAFHWTGSSWGTAQTVSGGVVYIQAWGSAATDVWALGGNSLSHFDGANWSTTTRSDFTVYTRGSISGLKSTGEWYAGGEQQAGPVVLHRSGTTFTVEPTAPNATCADTRGVWMGPGGDAWGVIGNLLAGTAGCPAIVHRENNAWVNKGAISTATNATAIWGTSSKDMYVTGTTAQGPALFHYDGTTWTPVYTPANVNNMIGGWSTGNPN
jgi:hypothetical protein